MLSRVCTIVAVFLEAEKNGDVTYLMTKEIVLRFAVTVTQADKKIPSILDKRYCIITKLDNSNTMNMCLTLRYSSRLSPEFRQAVADLESSMELSASFDVAILSPLIVTRNVLCQLAANAWFPADTSLKRSKNSPLRPFI